MIGAYALDALPPDEAEAMRAHMASCATHAEAIAELRAVAVRLHALVGETPPPAALRSRVLAAVAAEPAASRDGVVTPMRGTRLATTGASDARAANARMVPTATTSRRIPTYAWGSIAAVFVAAIAGLLVWNIVLQRRLDNRDSATQLAQRLERSVPLRAPDATSDGGGTVVFLPDERRAVVLGDELPALDAGHTYQMWEIDQQSPVSLGLMRADASGRGTAVVAFDSSRPAILAITIEPAGGSTQPTTPPILSAQPPHAL